MGISNIGPDSPSYRPVDLSPPSDKEVSGLLTEGSNELYSYNLIKSNIDKMIADPAIKSQMEAAMPKLGSLLKAMQSARDATEFAQSYNETKSILKAIQDGAQSSSALPFKPDSSQLAAYNSLVEKAKAAITQNMPPQIKEILDGMITRTGSSQSPSEFDRNLAQFKEFISVLTEGPTLSPALQNIKENMDKFKNQLS
jgi:hypothetical protein